MGSGSTKALAAVINVCENKIVKELYSEQVAIPFNDSLERSFNGEFDEKVVKAASDEVLRLITAMKKNGVESVNAVATSAFRKAKNGEASAQRIGKVSGIKIRVISQDEEAELGIRSALLKARLGNDPSPVGVWDIGGGSMQMTYGQKDQTQIFKGELASVSFKNKIITDLQKKDLEDTKTPNPLKSWEQKSIRLAADHAFENVSHDFKKQANKVRWLGIGGVWWHSLRSQVHQALKKDSSILTLKDLQKTLSIRSKMTDNELGGKYSDTDVSNIALVLGYMKSLGIKQVEPVDASLLQGLLF